jgi:hypothetical protein
MKTKDFAFALFLLLLPVFMIAQSRTTAPHNEPSEITAEEIAKALDVDNNKAEKLADLHKELRNELKQLREKNRAEMEAFKELGESKTDADYEKMDRMRFASQRERIDISEAYYEKFLEVATPGEVNKLMRMTQKHKSQQMRQREKHHQKEGTGRN